MPSENGAVRVEPAASVDAASALLRAAAPGVTNPAWERVVVAPDWADEIAEDPQRWSLVPAALAALECAHEVWRFAGEEAGEKVEHWPHLLWCQLGERPAELVIAGTRRIGGQLHLHTWFRYADGAGAVRRYWESGRAVHPVRVLRSRYTPSRDVLTLRPDPPVPYRVTRLLAQPSMFAYLDARIGYPFVIGFEIQDARRHARELARTASPAGILSLPCRVDDDPDLAPLSAWLTRLLGKEST